MPRLNVTEPIDTHCILLTINITVTLISYLLNNLKHVLSYLYSLHVPFVILYIYINALDTGKQFF